MAHGDRRGGTVDDIVRRLRDRLDGLPPEFGHRRTFLSAYLRTTAAVGNAIDRGLFEDPKWVTSCDVAFAKHYLEAHDADIAGKPGRVSRPWRLAFDAPTDLYPFRHILLGVNAHINYDLPQALLAVISDGEFDDPYVLNRRRRDHERLDRVVADRAWSEDGEVTALGAARSLLNPLNRLSSRQLLREARRKVWHNTAELQRARMAGADVYRRRLAELELLSAAKIADLMRPGQVLLRLAVAGFGVTLPPPDQLGLKSAVSWL